MNWVILPPTRSIMPFSNVGLISVEVEAEGSSHRMETRWRGWTWEFAISSALSKEALMTSEVLSVKLSMMENQVDGICDAVGLSETIFEKKH